MKHKATYILPEEVLRELNVLVEARQRNNFVAEAIRYALKKKLEEAYKETASDMKRDEELKEWDI